MDMFTDKLAQKLTAQEIIRANTAADVEELNRLKNQVTEYNECLGRLQKLIDDGFERLSGMKEDGDLVRLAAESADGTEALRRDVAELKSLLGQIQGSLEGVSRAVAGQAEAAGSFAGQVGSLQGQLAEAAGSLGERIDQLCGQLEAQSFGGLSERLVAVEENAHKECVKVYRNVQAVVVEECGKQNELLDGIRTEMSSVLTEMSSVPAEMSSVLSEMASVRRKAGAAKGFAIMAMVFSGLCAAGILFQILVLLGIVAI